MGRLVGGSEGRESLEEGDEAEAGEGEEEEEAEVKGGDVTSFKGGDNIAMLEEGGETGDSLGEADGT